MGFEGFATLPRGRFRQSNSEIKACEASCSCGAKPLSICKPLQAAPALLVRSEAQSKSQAGRLTHERKPANSHHNQGIMLQAFFRDAGLMNADHLWHIATVHGSSRRGLRAGGPEFSGSQASIKVKLQLNTPETLFPLPNHCTTRPGTPKGEMALEDPGRVGDPSGLEMNHCDDNYND